MQRNQLTIERPHKRKLDACEGIDTQLFTSSSMTYNKPLDIVYHDVILKEGTLPYLTERVYDHAKFQGHSSVLELFSEENSTPLRFRMCIQLELEEDVESPTKKSKTSPVDFVV